MPPLDRSLNISERGVASHSSYDPLGLADAHARTGPSRDQRWLRRWSCLVVAIVGSTRRESPPDDTEKHTGPRDERHAPGFASASRMVRIDGRPVAEPAGGDRDAPPTHARSRPSAARPGGNS